MFLAIFGDQPVFPGDSDSEEEFVQYPPGTFNFIPDQVERPDGLYFRGVLNQYHEDYEMRRILPMRINPHEQARRENPLNFRILPNMHYNVRRAYFPGYPIPIEYLDYENPDCPGELRFVTICPHQDHQAFTYPPTPQAHDLRRWLAFTLPCFSCPFCPTRISEHVHPCGQPCTPRCKISEPVYEPSLSLMTLEHNCAEHIHFSVPYRYLYRTFFRQNFVLPNLPFSPWFVTEREYLVYSTVADLVTRRNDVSYRHPLFVEHPVPFEPEHSEWDIREWTPERRVIPPTVPTWRDHVRRFFQPHYFTPLSRSTNLNLLEWIHFTIFSHMVFQFAYHGGFFDRFFSFMDRQVSSFHDNLLILLECLHIARSP